MSAQATLIWDGDCGFCRRHVMRWKAMVGEKVRFVTLQELSEAERPVPLEDLESAVHLTRADGSIYRGAEAVFQLMSLGGRRLPLTAYDKVPLVAPLSEATYRLVARNRKFFSRFI